MLLPSLARPYRIEKRRSNPMIVLLCFFCAKNTTNASALYHYGTAQRNERHTSAAPFMHRYAESGQHINQIIATLPDRRMIPCRIWLPVHQCGLVLRWTGDVEDMAQLPRISSIDSRPLIQAIISLLWCAGLLLRHSSQRIL